MNLDTYFMIKEAVRNRVRAVARAMPLPVEEPSMRGPVPDRLRGAGLERLETQRWPYNGAAPAPTPAPASPGRIRRPRALARALPLPTEEPAAPASHGRIRRPRALARAMPLPNSTLSPEEQNMLDIFRAGWNENRK